MFTQSEAMFGVLATAQYTQHVSLVFQDHYDASAGYLQPTNLHNIYHYKSFNTYHIYFIINLQCHLHVLMTYGHHT
jgi:hypothetical protein